MKEKGNKGISPLIAAVLLIAFVMATAGIVSNWFVTFSKEQSRKTTTKGEKEIKCSYAALEIRKAVYNNTNQKKEITLEVENTGSEALSDFRIQAMYKNNSVSNPIQPTDYNTTLDVGGITIFKDSGTVNSNLKKVSIYSKECATTSRTWLACKYIEGC